MRIVTIASGSQISADAGAVIADAGGNAVDAAIAAAMVSMSTEPGVIAPGASGYITVWPPDGEPVVIDAYAAVPGRGRRSAAPDPGETVHLLYGGGMSTRIGYGSVAVPGAFAGFGAAWEAYGDVPWSTLVQPAIDWAEKGFRLSGAAAQYLVFTNEVIFGWHPESRKVVQHADGRPVSEGERILIPNLAASLRAVAEEGHRVLYDGDLGHAIADEVSGNGGSLSRVDLAAYEPIIREPLRVRLDDWEVATNPPPAVGGAVLGGLLLLAEDHPFAEWTEEEVIRLARIERAVLRYRRDSLEPATDREAAALRLLELAGTGDYRAILGSPSTIHISAADSTGLACAITVSAGYGSGVMVPGTGWWLNNSLGELELVTESVRPAPGDRLLSNMAPTIARSDNGSVLAIGSPGASRITTAIAAVMLNFVHLGMSLRDAVAYPRLHVEVFDAVPTVAYEPGLPVTAFDDVVPRRFPDLSMYFGGVQAAVSDPLAGLFAAADPRRSGGVAQGGA